MDPDVPNVKFSVVHFVLFCVLSLYTHEHPLDEEGKFEYLPVPSFHDWDIGNTSIDWLLAKLLCSAENNSRLEENEEFPIILVSKIFFL